MNAIISILPVVLLFVLMLGLKVSGYKSALITLIVTAALALWVAPAIGIVPQEYAGESVYPLVWWSVVEGALKAIFPILIIILMAIYSYNVIVESKAIETIKSQFTSFTDDKGVLVLMMVWGFGGLLEGMAGFGTAVAIPAAILIGLGFKPMFSALVSLLGNTVATGFGAVGVPVITLCNEISSGGATATTLCEVSAFAVVQLAPLFFLIPFVILMLTDSKSWGKNICLSLWVGAVSLSVQLLCATFLGAETPAIIGSIAAILAIIVYARLFLPRKVKSQSAKVSTTGKTLKAWSVYIFILVFILVGGALCPPVEKFLKAHLVTSFPLPVVGTMFKFGWISNAGVMLFLGSVAGGLVQGLSVRQLSVVMARTIVNLRFTAVTIISLIALASVMNHSGMIAALAEGLVAVSGSFYPFFAPLIGAIGTFVTGSDTSSNILFGKLQANVAHQLGMTGQTSFCGFTGSEADWLASSNTAGATGGKMISPQSIAIATAACDMKGEDDAILRKAIPYAIGYIAICGVIVWLGC
ncbi:MAG: L-lactate permease [Muribaculaceae bacterium]|nr:L-lactate permease [Muribaculaceae bacterium]MDE6771585.1 L-lactate permease [Muribaculaceae bacterium]